MFSLRNKNLGKNPLWMPGKLKPEGRLDGFLCEQRNIFSSKNSTSIKVMTLFDLVPQIFARSQKREEFLIKSTVQCKSKTAWLATFSFFFLVIGEAVIKLNLIFHAISENPILPATEFNVNSLSETL